MKSLRVPQREVHAELRLHGGETRSGLLFVPAAGPDGGPGRLTDRLNDSHEAFLALKEAGAGTLVSKQRIVRVSLAASEREVEVKDQESRIPALVQLADGTRVEGEVLYAMPADRSRLIDYLNSAPRFIQLIESRVDGDRLVLINRDFLTTVTRQDDPED